MQNKRIGHDNIIYSIKGICFVQQGLIGIVLMKLFLIGKNAFYNCNKLLIIKIGNVEILSIIQTAFEYYPNFLFMVPVQK